MTMPKTSRSKTADVLHVVYGDLPGSPVAAWRCAACGQWTFADRRPNQCYCSTRCKMRAYRARQRLRGVTTDPVG